MNKSVVPKIIHNEYKYVFLNENRLRHSMNRIPSEINKIRTYDIKKNSLPCFKTHILNNEYDSLVFMLRVDCSLSKFIFNFWSHRNSFLLQATRLLVFGQNNFF